MGRLVIDVRMVDEHMTLRRWVSNLWWPALLLAQVALALCGVRHIDDGDRSMWDLAYVLALTAAITIEMRRALLFAVRWWVRPRP